MLKLFVWTNISATDIVFVLAHDVDEARNLVINDRNYGFIDSTEFLEAEPEIATEPAAFVLLGW